MKPIRLVVQGLRSFRVQQTIDFTGLSFFAILGDTGAGKSSLLEAMSYALFNAPTWEDRGVRDLMSSGASAMRVTFEFEIGGRRYTITRMTPRNGVGQHLLECLDDPESRRDNERPVNEFIRERLKIDRDTFLKTVVLPQGRFADLLLMSPGDRTRFLREILGFSVLEQVADRVRPRRDDIHLALQRYLGARSELPRDPSAGVAAAQKAVSEAEARQTVLEETAARLARLEEQRQSIKAEVTVQVELRRLLAAADSLIGDLVAIERIANPLRENLTARECNKREAERRLSTVTSELDRLRASGEDAEALRRLDRSLEAFLALASSEIEERNALTALEKQHVEMNLRQVAASELRDATAAEVENAKKGQSELFAAARLSESVANAARESAKMVSAERAALELLRAQLSKAESAFADATERLSLARAKHLDAELHLGLARDASVAAARSDAAAHAAADLHAGDECPVCRRVLPATFVAPAAPALDQAHRALKRAEEAFSLATKSLANADAQAEQLAKRVAENHEALRRAQASLEDAIRVASAYGLTGDADHDSARLADLDRELQQAQAACEVAERRLEVALKAQVECAAAYSDIAARLQAIQQSIDAVKARLDDVSRRRDEESKRLGKSISKKILVSNDLVRAERARIETALAYAQTAQSEHLAALSAMNHAQTELASATATLRSQVDEPLDHVFTRLMPFVEMHEVDAFFRVLVQRARVGEFPIAEFIAAAEAERARVSGVIEGRVAERAATVAALDRELSEALRLEDVDTLAELSAKRDEGMKRAAILRAEYVKASEVERRAAQISSAIDRLQPEYEVHAALVDELAANRFPKYVVELKQLELLKIGTTILGRMTKDRYGFSSSLGIVDRTISQERKPRTLSGGETFLASLALSLALVEISERSGVRFESLFLDEGFGTLDPDAFEQALTELQRQVAQGRMIAVITHVERVTEFIDDIVHVSKTPEGSVVTVERAAPLAPAVH